MKVSVYLIKDIETLRANLLEVHVVFETESTYASSAEVTVYLEKEDLPLSKIKELAILKAKEFLKKAIIL